MWSLRDRPNSRRSRMLHRTRHRPTLTIWRNRRPVSQPPLSTSSQQPPTAVARVKFISRNLEMYSKSSAGPLTHPSCKPQHKYAHGYTLLTADGRWTTVELWWPSPTSEHINSPKGGFWHFSLSDIYFFCHSKHETILVIDRFTNRHHQALHQWPPSLYCIVERGVVLYTLCVNNRDLWRYTAKLMQISTVLCVQCNVFTEKIKTVQM